MCSKPKSSLFITQVLGLSEENKNMHTAQFSEDLHMLSTENMGIRRPIESQRETSAMGCTESSSNTAAPR